MVLKVYDSLHEVFGYQNWWPIVENDMAIYHPDYRSCKRTSQHAFEIGVGAILTQNTAWKNVVTAIANLKNQKNFSADKLIQLSEAEIADLIRSSGYFNQKARKLKGFASFVLIEAGGDLLKLRKKKLGEVRSLLLGLWGIGPETADSIMLYALGFPIFVVDAYTRRIFSRLGVVKETVGYQEVQDFFHSALKSNPELFGEYHALLVRLGKDFCHPKPLCSDCPLRKFCTYTNAIL